MTSIPAHSCQTVMWLAGNYPVLSLINIHDDATYQLLLGYYALASFAIYCTTVVSLS